MKQTEVDKPVTKSQELLREIATKKALIPRAEKELDTVTKELAKISRREKELSAKELAGDSAAKRELDKVDLEAAQLERKKRRYARGIDGVKAQIAELEKKYELALREEAKQRVLEKIEKVLIPQARLMEEAAVRFFESNRGHSQTMTEIAMELQTAGIRMHTLFNNPHWLERFKAIAMNHKQYGFAGGLVSKQYRERTYPDILQGFYEKIAETPVTIDKPPEPQEDAADTDDTPEPPRAA